MQNNKFFRMLGLAARARKLNFGEGAVRDSVRTKLAKMVIVAQDASDNTKKKLSDNCKFTKHHILNMATDLRWAVPQAKALRWLFP